MDGRQAMRLIDADKLLNTPIRVTGNIPLKNGNVQPIEAIMVSQIESAPTIDPVHAAGGCYCRECKYYNGCGLCELHTTRIGGHDFCSYGEPKEQEEKQ